MNQTDTEDESRSNCEDIKKAAKSTQIHLASPNHAKPPTLNSIMDLPQFSTIMANWGAPTPTDTVYALSRTYAEALDASDPLQSLRSEFHIPTLADLASEEPPPPADPNQPVLTTPSPSQLCIYFCGNSLGLQPKRTAALINEELSIWATRGVTGHFRHPRSRPWVSIDEGVTQHLATVVGAKAGEVAAMGSLTGNIHLLLAGFYKPTASRWKVIMEGRAFPSDHVCSPKSTYQKYRRCILAIYWRRSKVFALSNSHIPRSMPLYLNSNGTATTIKTASFLSTPNTLPQYYLPSKSCVQSTRMPMKLHCYFYQECSTTQDKHLISQPSQRMHTAKG